MSEMISEFNKVHETEWTMVKFTKTNGTIREMTLVPKSLWGVYAPPKPTIPDSKSVTKRKKSQGVVTVLEKDVGWRSFREDSLIEFSKIETP